MQALAPIVLFTYKRLSETQKTVKALQKNFLAPKSELIVFSDGPKSGHDRTKVKAIRAYLKSISGFKKITIYESPVNKGLARSIIDGVTQVINQYGRVIVLEDDLISTPNFLDFMNQALNFYENKKEVRSINGYSVDIQMDSEKVDVFIHFRPYSWGWATWSNRWDISYFKKSFFDYSILRKNKRKIKQLMGEDAPNMLVRYLNGEIDSWYANWIYQHYKTEEKSVYPIKSKISNHGFSEEGTHCKGINVHKTNMDKGMKRNFNFDSNIFVNKRNHKEYLKYFSNKYKIVYRLKLLNNPKGREKLFNEFKERIS